MDTHTTSHLEYERGRTKQRELEHDVLVHLTEIGSAKWGAIYRHFILDQRGEIVEVLSQLANRRQIVVELDGTAKITASGTAQLQALHTFQGERAEQT